MVLGLFANPYIRDQVMTTLTTKAPGNVWPILPTEVAVTGGRSFWAYKRTGFLELQERLIEEIAVAAVWMLGVKTMNRGLDKLISVAQKRGYLRGIYSDVDWSKGFTQLMRLPASTAAHAGLSPLERFTYNHKHLVRTLGLKSAKWAIAVTVPLLLCGWVIPKLNQLKTEWILKTFYKNDASKPEIHRGLHFEGTNHPEYNRAKPSRGVVDYNADDIAGYTARMYSTAPQWSSPPGQSQQNQVTPHKPRFGGLMDRALSSLGWLGHYVDNTHYGQVLVVDAGITGGRMGSAWPRSPFESLEYGFRDAASLFFYLKSTPMIMDAFAHAAEKPGSWAHNLMKRLASQQFGTTVNLDQQVVNRLNQRLMGVLSGQAVDKAALETAWMGQVLPKASEKAIYDRMMPGFRTARVDDFLKTFERELAVYTQGNSQKTSKLLAEVSAHLGRSTQVSGGQLNIAQFEGLLGHVWKGQAQALPTLAKLTDAERFHLSTALKMAFHHHAGQSIDDAQKLVAGELAKHLTADQQRYVLANLKEAAELGHDRLVASTMRRAVQVAHQNGQFKLAGELDELTRLAERAVMEAKPMGSYVQSQLQFVLSDYRDFAKLTSKPNPRLAQLATQVEQALSGKLPTNTKLSKVLIQFAEALETNGRTFPRGLKWLQGMGLGHLSKEIHAVLPFIDDAKPLTNILPAHIEAKLSALTKALPKGSAGELLLHEYQLLIAQSQKQGGRIALTLTPKMVKNMSTYWKMLEGEFSQIVKGGLRHNPAFLRQSMKILQHLPAGAENYFDPGEVGHLRQLCDQYMGWLTKRIGTQSLNTNTLMQRVLKPMSEHNAFWRYSIYGAALGVAALGVGVLIPRLQNLMTKHLTGRDTHPGIAAVSDRTQHAVA